MAGSIEVLFVYEDGAEVCQLGRAGESIMDVAIDNGVRGIEAQCGGGCTCSTCHVYIDPKWLDRCGSKHPDEVDILEFTPGKKDNSRLSCQVKLSEELNGIRVFPADNTN